MHVSLLLRVVLLPVIILVAPCAMAQPGTPVMICTSMAVYVSTFPNCGDPKNLSQAFPLDYERPKFAIGVAWPNPKEYRYEMQNIPIVDGSDGTCVKYSSRSGQESLAGHSFGLRAAEVRNWRRLAESQGVSVRDAKHSYRGRVRWDLRQVFQSLWSSDELVGA